MTVDAFLIGIGGELRKLRAIEYFNIAGMAPPFWIFNEVSKKKKKNHFVKVVLLKKYGLFWGKSILSLELYIYKNMQSKNILVNHLYFGFAYLIRAVWCHKAPNMAASITAILNIFKPP